MKTMSSDKVKKSAQNRARLAQSVARRSHNPKVVSSILAPRIFEDRKDAPCSAKTIRRNAQLIN